MFTSVKIENFRGIERLAVDGLGRVNLVIGRNNAGKTALLEALVALHEGGAAAGALSTLQGFRMGRSTPNTDFEGFWRPLFRGGDARRGFQFEATEAGGSVLRFTMREGQGASPLALPHGGAAAPTVSWSLGGEVERAGESTRYELKGGAQGVTFAPATGPRTASSSGWVPAGRIDFGSVMRSLSRLKQVGRDGVVYELLRQIDARIQGMEILAPTGERAAVFVRIEGEPLLLPLSLMGEGVQRCLDIAVSIADETTGNLLAIDEFENGLHYTTLEPIWRWLAQISIRQGSQVFATTHSEECVQAACRAFTALGDDGLRVLRLDRREHETSVAVYDRKLVAEAERMGVEIRG
jgi:hypothetical protein